MINRGVLGKAGTFLDYATSLGGRASVTATRFLRFGTSSSFTLMIDILLLYIFVDFMFIEYLIASGFSFTISTSINYFINRSWGFKGTLTKLFRGYLLFLVFSIFGITLTVFLMWVFSGVLGFYYVIARIIVAVIEGTMTFIVNNNYTFKMPETVSRALNVKEDFFNK